ncbi:MAG: YIP1 family protein [Chloroflexota bacterium]|nr:YIP1 family protein [Chloroflexota bacterium]
MQQLDTSQLLDNIVNRVIRAAMLDVELYEEVEADETLTPQAIAVVAITAIAGGIGGALGTIIGPGGVGVFFLALIITPIIAVIGYFIWAALTYLIGTRLFEGIADYGEMLRAIGYSYGPQVLGALSFIPCIGWLLSLAGAIWALVAGVIAVRQALDFDTSKAVITCIIGWIVMLVVNMIFAAVGLGGAFVLGGGGLI